MTMITSLIDKEDNFERIRDQVAAILKTESVAQQALATQAGQDPAQWGLSVYTERANPWEQVLNDPANNTPIVNVWFDTESFDEAKSNVLERQHARATINIDCYGFAVTREDGAGHKAGDEQAAREAQRALRLVRNILMAAPYTYLGLRGLVSKRWPQNISVFQPQLNAVSVQNVIGGRLALRVDFNEFSPQVEGESLELVFIDVCRAEDGELLVEADYDYTTT